MKPPRFVLSLLGLAAASHAAAAADTNIAPAPQASGQDLIVNDFAVFPGTNPPYYAGGFYQVLGDQSWAKVFVGYGGYGLIQHTTGALSVDGYVTVGGNAGGQGTYVLSGANSTLTAQGIIVGLNSGSTGTFTLSAGSITSSNSFVGQQGTGTFNQTGGTYTLVPFGSNSGSLYVGSSEGGQGTYNLSGGTLDLSNTEPSGLFSIIPSLAIGVGATGTFNQSGGTVLCSFPLLIGANGGSGVYTLSGTGILRTFLLAINYSGAPSTGVFNLDGGTAVVSQIPGGSPGTSTFHFNGGTLQAGRDEPNYIVRLTTADVRGGGAKIDTAGHNVTVPQSLLHSTVAGDNAKDGGLTKLGAGTLTLAGNNTYTGNTTVSAGTLAVTGILGVTVTVVNGALVPPGTVTVANGATLAGTGTINGPVNIQAGGTLSPGLRGGGVLTLSDTLTLAADSTASFTLGGTAAGSGYTQVLVGGQLTLGGASLALAEQAGFTPVMGQTFFLFDKPGMGLLSVDGVFGNAPGGIYTDASGNTFLVNYLANNPADGTPLAFNDVSVTVLGVVPEPSTWALLSVGITGLGFAHLRRRPCAAGA